MKKAQKDYQYAFLLEPTKLTRLIEIIHERLNEHPQTIIRDHFEAFLPANRVEEVTSLEDVVSLENSRKKRIERLLIVSSGGSRGAGFEHQVEVDFGVVKSPINSVPATTPQKVIAVKVSSNDSAWNARVLSEVEEQLERTRLHQTAPILTLASLVLLLLAAVLFQLPPVKQDDNLSRVLWLDRPSLDRVEKILNEGRTITEEEMREINTIQLRNLLRNQKPQPQPQLTKGQAKRLAFLGLPTLVLVVCAMALVLTCYPRAVFLWGDENERYATLLQRRKIIWGVIVGMVIVGLSSKFLYEGIASWIPRE